MSKISYWYKVFTARIGLTKKNLQRFREMFKAFLVELLIGPSLNSETSKYAYMETPNGCMALTISYLVAFVSAVLILAVISPTDPVKTFPIAVLMVIVVFPIFGWLFRALLWLVLLVLHSLYSGLAEDRQKSKDDEKTNLPQREAEVNEEQEPVESPIQVATLQRRKSKRSV